MTQITIKSIGGNETTGDNLLDLYRVNFLIQGCHQILPQMETYREEAITCIYV